MTPQEIYKKYGYYILQNKQDTVASQPQNSSYQYQQPSQGQPQQQQPVRRGGCCGRR